MDDVRGRTRKDGASSGGVDWWKTAGKKPLTMKMALVAGMDGGSVEATSTKKLGSRAAVDDD